MYRLILYREEPEMQKNLNRMAATFPEFNMLLISSWV